MRKVELSREPALTGQELGSRDLESTLALVHELEMQRIEADARNEELRRMQRELEASRDRYVHLYEFAPAGYFTLDAHNTILDVNLTGSSLLGLPRRKLIGKRFTRFVSPGSEDSFHIHRTEVLERTGIRTCEVELLNNDGTPLHARLSSISEPSGPEEGRKWRTAVTDISDKKSAEVAIKDALAYAESIIDTVREPLLVLDHALKVVSANRSFYEMFKSAPEYTEGQQIFQWNQSCLDVPGLRKVLWELVFRAKPFNDFLIECDFPDLGARSMLVNARQLRFENSARSLFMLAISDVSEQKKAEKHLRESEEHYAALVRHLPHSVFKIGNGVIIWCNDVVTSMYGYAPEELAGRPVAFFFQEAAGPDELARINAGLRKEGTFTGETFFYKKNGQLIELTYSVSKIAGARPLELVAVASDITEQKKMERARQHLLREVDRQRKDAEKLAFNLALEKDLLQTIMENTHTNLAMLDTSFNFVRVNTGYARASRHTIDELVGRNIFDIFRDNERAIFEKVRDTGESMSFTATPFDYRHKSRHIVTYWDWTLVPVKDSQGKVRGLVLSLLDATEREKSAEERRKLNEQLAEKNKELEQIIYTVSHDLRSPLVNIKGFASELRYSLGEIDGILGAHQAAPELEGELVALKEDVLEPIEHIDSGIQKIEGLLAALLRVSRAGRSTPNMRVLDTNQMVQRIVREFSYGITQSGARVEVGELPPCYGDGEQLSQVFSNLLDNAIKYRDPGRPLAIKIAGQLQDGHAVYWVEDNGLGLREEDRSRLFQIFQRFDPDVAGGEGLGLAIVNKYVSLHGGEIRVESARGHGSKFIVRLPDPARESPEGGQTEKPRSVILLAEDNPGHASLVMRSLKRAGIKNTVVRFTSGNEVFRFLTKKKAGEEPYILLLDISMPGADGISVLRQIRQHNELSALPVIMLTTNDDPREIELCRKMGCTDYLVKPAGYSKLADVIREVQSETG